MKNFKEEKSISARLPLCVYKDLYCEAVKENRSMAKQLIEILIKHYEYKGK